MKLILVLVSIFALSCGSDKKIEENHTNCAVEEVAEGVKFSCVDKDGKQTSGVVKHGEAGAKGETGAVGAAGEAGKGLVVVKEVQCKGALEAWVAESSYEIEFKMSEFETGHFFLSSMTQLKRGSEVINARSASAFYLPGGPIAISDGLLTMVYSPEGLAVKSQGGINAVLPCKEIAL